MNEGRKEGRTEERNGPYVRVVLVMHTRGARGERVVRLEAGAFWEERGGGNERKKGRRNGVGGRDDVRERERERWC